MKHLFCAAVWLVMPALARDKTDVLVMKNGDRITCEVKRLEGGIIEVNLDYVDGAISIDWNKVARIESEAMFLVQLQDGSIYSGKVITPERVGTAPAKLEILQGELLGPVAVSQADVVRVTQTSPSFKERFDAGVTIGSIYSKGNQTTQYNVQSDLGYEAVRWAARIRYSSNLSSSTGAETATRNQIDFGGYRRFRHQNYFYAATAGYLRSSVQGIENQTNLGFGIGTFLINRTQARLTILGGVGWQRTIYESSGTSTVENRQDVGVFLINSSLELFRFKKMRLTARGFLIPAFTDPGRVYVKTDVSYYLKLFGKIDWNLSVYGNWDSRPPMQFSGSDYGSSTGFSYSFGNR